MARKKRAWNMSNPLYRYLQKSKAGTKKRKRGVKMTKRGRSSSRGNFGKAMFPISGFIGAALLGLGVAAVAKRFVGAPLGGFTGTAAGFAVGGLPGAVGGYVHDNIGNVGGASSSQQGL